MKWRDIKGFEDSYEVSDTGLVRSKKRIVSFYSPKRGRHGEKHLKAVTLKPGFSRGHAHVGLKKNGKSYDFYVHRLVVSAFLPNPKKYKEVDHINRNRSDNRLENLRWCSSQHNHWNRGKSNNTTSKYIGVSYSKKYKKWRAYIRTEGRFLNLGSHEKEDDAGR